MMRYCKIIQTNSIRLCFQFCPVSPERLEQVTRNIHDTIGVDYEIIAIDNREKQWPIARAYNEGASRAHYPFLFLFMRM